MGIIVKASRSSSLALALSISFTLVSFSPSARVTQVPIVSDVVTYAKILEHQVSETLVKSTVLTRDTSLFLVAGLTLDAYVLTLPISGDLKKRLLSQISDPSYAIPLAYFLRMFYDRYTGVESGDLFKRHLIQVYGAENLKPFEHSLFSVSSDTPTPASIDSEIQSEGKDESSHGSGFTLNRDTIAALLVVYDELVNIGTWLDTGVLPTQYQYLTASEQDKAIVDNIQPIVVNVLKQVSQGMDEGDIKTALLHVVEDINTAQAVTVTLIDFVRLNVLKAYRQYANNIARQDALAEWMENTLEDEPAKVIDFLASQESRKFAVQIVVDGLQQGLLEGLVDKSSGFIPESLARHQAHSKTKPQDLGTQEIAYEQQLDFLTGLAKADYRDNIAKDEGYLPFFKALYAEQRSGIVKHGTASSPTISVRNLPIAKTGAKVSGDGGTGIPNFHFVDREIDRAYYFFGNDALQLDKLAQQQGVKTMFERLAHLNTLSCNAQYDWHADISYDALINLAMGEAQRDFGEKRCLRELQTRAQAEVSLSKERKQLIDELKDYQETSSWRFVSRMLQRWQLAQRLEDYAKQAFTGLPDYTLIYNPWPDHFAHFKGPFSDEIIAPTGELNRLDYWLGQYQDAYITAGVNEKTLWGMAGDHGLTPVYYLVDPEVAVLDPLADKLGRPVKISKISSDEGEGPKLTNAMNPPSLRNEDIVIASTAGGNFMLDLFNSEKGWQVQPVYKELTKWRPHSNEAQTGTSGTSTISNLDTASSVDLISELASGLKESLDYLVVREAPCRIDDCKVRLVGSRDGQRLDEIIERKGKLVRYYSLSHSRPRLLELEKLNTYGVPLSNQERQLHKKLIAQCDSHGESKKWCSGTQWQQLTSVTSRPNSVNQLIALYESPRAGTINLFPKDGIGYNTRVPGRHAGESYLEKDAFVGFWGAGLTMKPERINSGENGSLAPTLYHYLTGDSVIEGENSWGYPAISLE